MKIKKDVLIEAAKNKPKGYLKEVFAYSSDAGDSIDITEKEFQRIRLKYRMPKWYILVYNFCYAMVSFLFKPNKRAPKDVLACNKACYLCDFWVEKYNRCGDCGCFLAVKTYSKEWDCPQGKWPH